MAKALKEILQKYARLKGDEIVVFHQSIDHSKFRNLEPISAGQCIVDPVRKRVNCFGQSMTLAMESKEEDSDIATEQFFGLK